jgi:hypothetical protein
MLEQIVKILTRIPDVVCGAIAGSIITLFGTWLQGIISMRAIDKQLKYDSEKTKKERLPSAQAFAPLCRPKVPVATGPPKGTAPSTMLPHVQAHPVQHAIHAEPNGTGSLPHPTKPVRQADTARKNGNTAVRVTAALRTCTAHTQG